LKNPQIILENIKESFKSYYSTAFHLRSKYEYVEKMLMGLFDKEGLIARQPEIELMPKYKKTNIRFDELTGENGTRSLIKEDLMHAGDPLLNSGQLQKYCQFLGLGMIKGFEVYEHQLDMLRSALSGKHSIITSGTGSGKTEAFLMPLFAQIFKEIFNDKKPWAPASARAEEQDYWKTEDQGYVNCRKNEARPAAMRAMIIYPMNALVEDQMSRMRMSLCSLEADKYFRDVCLGNRIYIGRYNGNTPISGSRLTSTGIYNSSNFKKLKKKMALLERFSSTLAEGDDDEWKFSFPIPSSNYPGLNSSELVNRWDMQEAPPDIFITNFSMLSIVLMRSYERDIFNKTKDWLACKDLIDDGLSAADIKYVKKDRIFHLVLDELHPYREMRLTPVSLAEDCWGSDLIALKTA